MDISKTPPPDSAANRAATTAATEQGAEPNSDLETAAPAEVSAFRTLKRVGLAVVFLWFLIGGVAHFTATDVEMRIVPPAIPWPRAAVLLSGVFELAGAAGLLIPATRRAAGIGLFILTIAVTPANVYMLQHAELFNVPRWALIVRLPFQVALLALIIWCTRATVRAI